MFDLPLTVGLNDKKVVSSKLSKCLVLLVSNVDTESSYMIKVCQHFDVEYRIFEDLAELAKNFVSHAAGNSTACIIQEDLFDKTVFDSLSEFSKKVVLITYGPRGLVDQGQSHYTSLTRIIPTVLMQDLSRVLDYENGSKKQAANSLHEKTKVTFEGLKILVAEDNLVNQKVMTRMFDRLGITDVTIANNGKIATELTEKESYDFVFMDMEMPVMDGLQATRIIKERAESAHQKVVFLTAHTPDDFETTCRENGAEDFISKPCTIGDIRTCLQKLLAP